MIYKYKTGIICGAFDLIHPGYISMFRDAKDHCEELVVYLQDNPAHERPEKLSPIMGIWERAMILKSIRYIDRVETYSDEAMLERLLEKEDFQVRILGDDYKNKEITGMKEGVSVVFINRDHGWSNTRLVELIVKRGLPNGV